MTLLKESVFAPLVLFFQGKSALIARLKLVLSVILEVVLSANLSTTPILANASPVLKTASIALLEVVAYNAITNIPYKMENVSAPNMD